MREKVTFFCFFSQDACCVMLYQPGDGSLLLNVTYTAQCTVPDISLLFFASLSALSSLNINPKRGYD